VLQARGLHVRVPKRSLNFSIYLILLATLGPGVKKRNNVSGEKSAAGA
jgi:hypothetical protein